jgi:DNA ligase-1
VKAFAELYAKLDETTKTTAKVDALKQYFASAPAEDAAWAVFFLTGRKPRQVVPNRWLRMWAAEVAGIPDWLFEECYHAVGDLAETMALLAPEGSASETEGLCRWVEGRLLPLRGSNPESQKAELLKAWSVLGVRERFVWNKLMTGAFRVGVSQSLVVKALAEVGGVEPSVVAHRLMGSWEPTREFYRTLVDGAAAASNASRPYPFFLASPLEGDPAQLGPSGDWQVEWKWDGIRSQLIRRGGESFLWSRGEENVGERFPEILALGDRLPEGTVIDGEILPWKDGAVRPFAELQKRIGRKNLTKKILAEVPVVLLAYDLLEWEGRDLRGEALAERREQLERLERIGLRVSPVVEGADWLELAGLRERSRSLNVEGFMLKRRSAPYRVGRVRGDWWKWKIDPLSVDAVLVYAQRGSGKRASLYTDYTFAVRHDDKLVPFAKAYSGLTDAEIRRVDSFIKANTVESFGPVRTVRPELVFEIGFEGIQKSGRHKSGVAVRFPRILKWRTDKSPAEADTLETLTRLLTQP